MADHAYVLINVELGSESKVMEALRGDEGVEEAYQVYGVYDVVAKVRSVRGEGIREVIGRMRRVTGVRNTLTLIPIEGFEK